MAGMIEEDDNSDDESPILVEGPFGARINVKNGIPRQHKDEHFPPGDLSFYIVGKKGSGKSQLVCSIIPNIANISQVIVCSKITSNKVYDALIKWCASCDPQVEFALLTEPKQACAEIESLVNRKAAGTDGVIVLDDFSEYSSSRANAYNKVQNMVFGQFRNLGYHVIFVTQPPTNVQTQSRINTDIKIAFRVPEAHAKRIICSDFMASGIFKTKEEFEGIYSAIERTNHGYVMQVDKGKVQKIYVSIPKQQGKEGYGPKGRTNEGEYELREVQLHRDVDVVPELESDAYLKRLIDDYQKNAGHDDDVSRINMKMLKARLQQYIRGTAEKFDVDKDAIVDAIMRLHKIEL